MAPTAFQLDELRMAALGRRELIPSLIGLASVAAVLLFLATGFAPAPEATLFRPWLAATTAVVVINAAMIVVAMVRQPGDREAVRVWQPLGRASRTLLNLAIIPSPWVLLPGAEPAFVAVMLMLYLWFLATEIMATADPHSQTWVALIGLPASLAAFLLLKRAAYAAPLTLLFALASVSLFFLQRLIRTGAIRSLATPAAAPLAPAAISETPVPPALTRRQLEVLGHLSEGRSNKEIARALGLSPETIKSHVAQTLAAMACANRTDAALKAKALRLI